ncbi:hypothetical protein ACQ4LE_009033 [Meloidogyne hapla]
MKLLKLLLIAPLILSLQYLIEASSSSGNRLRCPCGDYYMDKLTNHEFVLTTDNVQINLHFEKHIESNEEIHVKHAYWENKEGGAICVDLKIINLINNERGIYDREKNLLKFFRDDVNEAKHIIHMYHSRVIKENKYGVMVLEKAKSNIRDCYEKIQEDSELDILIKIVKGAARALAQLHEYEFVHLNVKTESFVYTEIPENENEVENCKLTGLEKANLSSQEIESKIIEKRLKIEPVKKFCSICQSDHNENETVQLPCGHFFHRKCISTSICKGNDKCPNCTTMLNRKVTNILYHKLDAKSFGYMVNNLMELRGSVNQINEGENHSKLISIIKACDHHKYDEIPTMDKILDFLNGVIDLSTFQNPEYGRHYKQGESSHGGHEVGGGSTGHEHELASTSHAQHSYGGDSQVPGVQEHESRQSPGCNFFGCFTGRGGRD